LALALTLAAWCGTLAQSMMDIDYSHDIKGTGTVITDYRMDDQKSSQASGRIRGTGDVMNKYVFLSRNDSENVTIEDQFVLSKKEAAPTMPQLSDFPRRPDKAVKFRLMGTSWAKQIEVADRNESGGPARERFDFFFNPNQPGLTGGYWQSDDYLAPKTALSKTSIWDANSSLALVNWESDRLFDSLLKPQNRIAEAI